jgi:hypothetical protein
VCQGEVQRRGRRGGDAIYFDHRGQCRDTEHHRHCPGRWRGAISRLEDGQRVRRKVSGRTKSEVKDKLKALHEELDQGVKPSASYKVADTLTDWLEHGLDGRSPKTVSTYREVTAPLLPLIGTVPLRELTASDVRAALTRIGATRSSRSVTIASLDTLDPLAASHQRPRPHRRLTSATPSNSALTFKVVAPKVP